MNEDARTELSKLRFMLELLKASPPSSHEAIDVFGQKMLEIADLNLRIAEFQLEHSLRDPT